MLDAISRGRKAKVIKPSVTVRQQSPPATAPGAVRPRTLPMTDPVTGVHMFILGIDSWADADTPYWALTVAGVFE